MLFWEHRQKLMLVFGCMASRFSFEQWCVNDNEVQTNFVWNCFRYSIQLVLPKAIKSSENVCCSTPGVGIQITKMLFQGCFPLLDVLWPGLIDLNHCI